MFGYLGGLIATWTYLPADAPRYFIGNSINLACAALWTGIAIGAGIWMRYDNNKREEKEAGAHEELAGMTVKEIQDLGTTAPTRSFHETPTDLYRMETSSVAMADLSRERSTRLCISHPRFNILVFR
jgi:hypothetical protein